MSLLLTTLLCSELMYPAAKYEELLIVIRVATKIVCVASMVPWHKLKIKIFVVWEPNTANKKHFSSEMLNPHIKVSSLVIIESSNIACIMFCFIIKVK